MTKTLKLKKCKALEMFHPGKNQLIPNHKMQKQETTTLSQIKKTLKDLADEKEQSS